MFEKVIDNAVFVVCSPRMPTAARSTGEGSREGTRIEEIKQIVFSDAFLRPLAGIKSRLRRMLIRSATPIDSVNAWLVPKNKWDSIKSEVASAEQAWGLQVDACEQALDREVDELCTQNPQHAGAIRANALSVQDFRKATRFIFSAFSLSKEQVLESSALAQELGDLAYQVIDDLAKLIIDCKRDKSTRFDATTREFIEVLAAKAHSFAFVDERVGALANQLDEAMSVLPKGNRLGGASQDLVSAIFSGLLRPGDVLKNGLQLDSHIKSVKTEMMPKPVPVVAPPPAPVQPAVPARQDALLVDQPVKAKRRLAKATTASDSPVQTVAVRIASNPVCI